MSIISGQAQGDHICTVTPQGGSRDAWSGTSAAAPLVTATAAVLQCNADFVLAPEDFQGLLQAGCVDVTSDQATPDPLPGFDKYSGAGILNVAASLERLTPPYTVMQIQSRPENITWTELGQRTVTFSSGARVLPFPEGTYAVDAFQGVSVIDYGARFVSSPAVWAVGTRCSGLSLASPSYGEGFAEVVLALDDFCVARTYLYFVNAFPWYIGWWPEPPGAASIGVTLSGQLAVADVTRNSTEDSGLQLSVTSSPGFRPVMLWSGAKQSDALQWELTDVAGRTLHRFTMTAPAATGQVTWDQLASRARRLHAGVYFVRVLQRTRGAEVRVVLVR